MASGSNSCSVSGQNVSGYSYTLSVSYSSGSQSITGNYTSVSLSASLSGQYIGWSGTNVTMYLYWHDNRNGDVLVSQGTWSNGGYAQSGTHSLSGNVNATHYDDGSLSGCYAWARIVSNSGSYAPNSAGPLITNGDRSFPTIARASSISGLSGSQLGSSWTVSINRKSSGFTHKVEYSYGGSDYTSVGSGLGTSVSFTPSLDLAKNTPNSASGTLTVRVTTYSGSTQIGSSVTSSATCSIPSSVVPTIGTFASVMVNGQVPSSWGIYVQGYSKVTLTASTISGAYGSSIKSCTINGSDVNYSSSTASDSYSVTSDYLHTTGTHTYTVTVTDTRGRTATKSLSIDVVEYAPPTISITAQRCNSDKTVSDSGIYLLFNCTFGIASVSDKNSVASKSVTCNGVSNTSFYSNTSTLLSCNMSIGSSYTVTATVTDQLGNKATATATIPTSYRIINVRSTKKGIAFGKVSEKDGMEVNMPVYVSGDISVTVNGSTYNLSGLISRLVALETWQANVLNGSTKVVVEE